MPQQFSYKAMDTHGRIIQGQLTADNANDLEARLERMGLDLIHCRGKTAHSRRAGKVTRQELITFCFYMEQLTRSGVPVLDGLADLRDSLPQSRFREVVSGLYESIQGGQRLSEALSHFSETFDKVFSNLIKAGEESGNLDVVFKHLTENLKWQDELIAKTKKLMMYPAFVGVVIVGVLFFLMIYLVPQLVSFIKSMGQELPLHTRILIVTSNIFAQYWYLILGIPVVSVVVINSLLQKSLSLRFKADRLKLKVWLIGPILEKIILARFASFFALLYGSGITVIESLSISKELSGNLVVEAALQRVIDNIADGVSISESFSRARLFPPLVLRMVKVGEGTGELDMALLNVSYFYDREVKDSIDKIQTLIEPIMTIIMGLLLGWVMISVLGPIYDMITKFDFK